MGRWCRGVGEEEGKDEERRMEGTLIASCSFGSVFGWSDREASAASQSGSRVSKEKKTQVEGTSCVCSSNRAPGLEYALVAR
jgi:hypothetical protein